MNEDLLKVVRVSKKGPIRNNALTLVQKLVDNEFWEEDHLASGEGNKELVPKGQFEFSSNFDFVPQKQSIEVRVSIIKKTIGSSKEKPK